MIVPCVSKQTDGMAGSALCQSNSIWVWTFLLTFLVDLDLQVQPDLDELPVNMEDNEDAESTKSEVKLGKLQFSLDYDFQKGEVRLSSVPGGMLFTVIAVENAKH